MQCNIDQKGRTARIVTGAIAEAIGFGLVAAWYLEAVPQWAFWAGIGAIVGGNVSMVEGMIGWCVVRAMGIKTPM